MKFREGKAKVPILPRAVQIAFASVTGVAFIGLLIFIAVHPTTVEPSLAQVETGTAQPAARDGVAAEVKESVSIDGVASELSTVEKQKPVIVAPQVADGITVDGETEEEIARRDAAEAEAEKQSAAQAQAKADAEAKAKAKAAADAEKARAAAEANVAAKRAAEQEATKKKPSAAPKQYVYSARAGDSYTVMARSAVALYAKTQNVTLSPAQRVAAETFITQGAGAPLLDVAQQVTISVDTVKAAVDQAQDLTDDELAAWDVFADQVDFDADDTPEPAADAAGGADAVSDTGASDTGISGGAASDAGAGSSGR